MLSRLRSQASPAALAISMIALFVAISGVAGALPGKNTVNSGDVKKNSLKSGDLKNDGVTGADVKESTLEIPASAVTKDTFGASVTQAAQVTTATLPGTTASIDGAGAYTVTFPRSVQGCIPVVSDNDGGAVAARAFVPGGNPPGRVFVGIGGGADGFNVLVAC
jgi:hypothetical protein